jgi:hypothetical protein
MDRGGAAVIDRPPLALSDFQMKLVRSAAAAVPVRCRDEFLQGVAKRLTAEASDAAVAAAVNLELNLVPHEPTHPGDNARSQPWPEHNDTPTTIRSTRTAY